MLLYIRIYDDIIVRTDYASIYNIILAAVHDRARGRLNRSELKVRK